MESQRPLLVQSATRLVLDYRVREGKGEFLAGGQVIAVREDGAADVGTNLRASGLFACPRALGLIGTMSEQGVEALVVAVVQPDDEVQPLRRDATETWKEAGVRPQAVVLGLAMRPRDWCLSGDLGEELAGMLRSIVGEAGALTPEQQTIENLLKTI